ncbi:MAG: S-methyl-5-thioribose-1-phosphate isomerase [Mariprofundaceae bacterium]|nr:S-methyl-5-thioribose-1-phosphate isomerase [Mariprofundaceae bacterium]
MLKKPLTIPPTIQWQDHCLSFIDQTRLPHELIMVKQENIKQVWHAIHDLQVRGAPAIGVAAAYGLCVGLREKQTLKPTQFLEEARQQAAYLNSSRPTAVNLSWALTRMLACAHNSQAQHSTALYAELVNEAEKIHQEDQQLCLAIGQHGLKLIKKDMRILTHCNAGALATSGIGTATAPMYTAHQQGIAFKVFADETRPLLQGARLTAWELQQAGIDITLITDNMAAHMMSEKKIDMVIVGTDRVAANGDVANKIGTLGVAILAQYFNIPFYVACPSSTIDLSCPTGKNIPIEERQTTEVSHFSSMQTAPQNISIRNPAFDVTPHHLVSGLITEKGIIEAPYNHHLKNMFKS